MSMQLSSWAIRRPIPTIVLFLVLAIAGWTSFLGLPINANPRVDFPVVTVAVPQVGAAPTELEHAVTLRVERAVSGLAGIRHHVHGGRRHFHHDGGIPVGHRPGPGRQ